MTKRKNILKVLYQVRSIKLRNNFRQPLFTAFYKLEFIDRRMLNNLGNTEVSHGNIADTTSYRMLLDVKCIKIKNKIREKKEHITNI